MDKQEIIQTFQKARTAHENLLNDGQILLDGFNLERLEEPVKYEECDLTHWCESHLNNISSFPWFAEFKESHINLHNKFSVLFYESMRKYNPKTFNQLLSRFDNLKSEVEIFNTKLDDIETELIIMSDDQFDKFASKHLKATEDAMQSVEINKYEDDSESNEIDKTDVSEKGEIISYQESVDLDDADQEVVDKKDDDNNDAETSLSAVVEDVMASSEIGFTEIVIKSTSDVNSTNHDNDKTEDDKDRNIEFKGTEIESELLETINKHISLKEQNIVQLQQKKQLSELELANLENTQKLTLQSTQQLKNSINLKQQEIELDQKDNDKLIAFKNNARKATEEALDEIAEAKDVIQQHLQDLEDQILEAQIKQESDKSGDLIAKQFEELKSNKNKDLNKLQQYLQLRKVDLKQLKDQMKLLEEEIAEMEQGISKKTQDMNDLEEKEKSKNEERAVQISVFESTQNEYKELIQEKQIELDKLNLEDQEKQKELEVIDFQIDELNKSNELIVSNNTETLKNIEQQKEDKLEKITEIDKLKNAKQSEIDEIETLISNAEGSLVEMKSTQNDGENELAVAD